MSEVIYPDYFQGIKVEMIRVGTDIPSWDKSRQWQRYKYAVMISKGKISAQFPFWGSAVDWKNDKDPEPLEALRCYVSDALLYADSADLDDYADQYCEGMKVSETIESYNFCKNAFAVLGKMGFDQADIPILDIDLNKRLDGE